MKNILRGLICVFLSAAIMLCGVPAALADGDVLLNVGGKTLTENMTLDDISSVFGQAKILTDSAFGGKAATYFEKNGDTYSYYLYVETDSNRKIASYATFTPNYSAPGKMNFGEVYGNGGSVYYAQGSFAYDSDDNKIWAGCYYTKTANFNTYFKNWKNDRQNYLAGLQKHSSAMFSAAGTLFGKNDLNFTFNEELFYTNEQLKSTGTDLYEWAENTGKSKYTYMISRGSDMLCGYAYVPNPIIFVRYAENYTVPESNSYACFDYSANDDMTRFSNSVVFVNPEILLKSETVALTDEETKLLKRAREIYAQSVADFNSAAEGGYFETDYQFKNLPLAAGKLKSGILKGTLGYLNAIRAGAGLGELTLSEELCDRAQHKAVLTAYMAYNGISNPNPHYPSKPDGVDDEFYNKASCAGGENLYNNSLLGGDFVIGSINNALQEAYGDTIACGHRYNLLDPYWTTVGFGTCSGQGVHEFSGNNSQRNDEVVCWPSKGIMLADAVHESYRWTIKFYSGGYTVNDNTSVEIKNLASGKVWKLDKSSNDFRTVGSNELSFFDNTISYTLGDVVEVTVKNLDKNGQNTVYSYRTVFASVTDDGSSSIEKINISKTEAKVRVGSTIKLNAAPDNSEAANQLIRWSSSDENVAAVTADGHVTGISSGTAVITAVSDAAPNVKAICSIEVIDADTLFYGDVNADGSVNATDALITLQHSVGKTTLEGTVALNADVNADNAVNATDALLILQYSVNKITVFPAEQKNGN